MKLKGLLATRFRVQYWIQGSSMRDRGRG